MVRSGSWTLAKKLNHPFKKLNHHAGKGTYQVVFTIGNNLYLLCFPVQLEHVFYLDTCNWDTVFLKEEKGLEGGVEDQNYP